MLSARNFTMEPAVHSDFAERLNAVKTAARARVLGRYGLKDLFREHAVAPAAPGIANKAKAFGKCGKPMGLCSCGKGKGR
jgi:hypothetical protein